MEENYRYWLIHQKLFPFHFLSQLDLNRFWERAARRGGLPLAFSQGFNPRPLFSFGPATPVGVESRVEVFELTLTQNWLEEEIKEKLNREGPAELAIQRISRAPSNRKLSRAIRGLRYSFWFSSSLADSSLEEGLSLPAGIEWEKKEFLASSGFVLSFWFKGEKVFSSPIKFVEYLSSILNGLLPEKIIKEEVFLETEGSKS
ncbi:MAG: hypothetical protein PWP04_287 [Candidatus Atribacteria bacterium]|nr:hypothetical protein [Candidatus Atribacteria bacterium]